MSVKRRMRGTYLEQFERMKRALDKIERVYSGLGPGSGEECRDDVLSFFQNCHHFKDWLINDPSGTFQKDAVEGFINAHRKLQLAADLCNGSKHLTLRDPRSVDAPTLGAQSVVVDFGAGGNRYNFIIDTLSGPLDALALGRQCFKLWRQFIK